jgi:transcriptional regulator NrdR family protein
MRPARAKVPCPNCRSRRSHVIDCGEHPRSIREQLDWSEHAYWRRRKCLDCGATFDTAEEITPAIKNLPNHPTGL